MVKQTIQIFARVKPTKARTGRYEVDEDDEGCPRLTVTVPKELADGFINNKREHYKFRFEKVFDQKTTQDEVFQHVAQPVIDNVLQGYNGTIFAYGQTGSGKTFTITGGAERYIDRGIIPRTLSYVYDKMEKENVYKSPKEDVYKIDLKPLQTPELTFTMHVSYLEIYNEMGFDLLDPKHEASKLEDLPKVSLMEDSDQNIHLKNLSVHQAATEEEALNLLFLGDTNRMIAETPMNQASTRSHCIFTIHLTARETGSATIRRAKLHLVDLAGSERVAKSGVNGVLLTEAKYINLSLHFLEQVDKGHSVKITWTRCQCDLQDMTIVIIALSEKKRQHIPYRNSMMTSVLRDSLGGNCMTTMIATCSVDKKNIDESISTCRFAQRVAMIKNDVLLNEELDPKLMIIKLKREIQQLKEELAMATGQQRTEELTEEELMRCEEAVNSYLEDTDPESVISVGADMRKIHTCFSLLRKLVLEKPASSASPVRETTPVDTGPYNNAETQKLKELVMQRDNEINILVNMLKKEKKRASEAVSLSDSHRGVNVSSSRRTRLANGDAENGYDSLNYSSHSSSDNRLNEVPRSRDDRRQSESDNRLGEVPRSRDDKRQSNSADARRDMDERRKTKILGKMSVGRQEAFDIFMRDYEHNPMIEENKKVLKRKYADAKNFGETLNQAKSRINHVKAQIEQHRMQQAMEGRADPDNPEPDEEEQILRHQMEEYKAEYKETFTHLREMKTEIEHLQHLLEKAKVKLMKDFELWWADQSAALQDQSIPQSVQGSVKSAWRTPPLTPLQNTQRNYTQEVINPVHTEASLPRPPSSSRGRRTVAGNIASNLPSDPGGQLHKSRPAQHTDHIPLTGDSKADADIMAFIKARQNLMQKVNPGNR